MYNNESLQKFILVLSYHYHHHHNKVVLLKTSPQPLPKRDLVLHLSSSIIFSFSQVIQ